MIIIAVCESDMECVRQVFPDDNLKTDCALTEWPEWAQSSTRMVADHRHRAVARETFSLTQKFTAGPDKVLRCAFCGHEYPEGTPEAKSKILADHIRVCHVHPVGIDNRALKAKLTKISELIPREIHDLTGDRGTFVQEQAGSPGGFQVCNGDELIDQIVNILDKP